MAKGAEDTIDLTDFKGFHYTADDRFIYAKKGRTEYKLAVFTDHLYKLRLMQGVPVLEIDGLRMQLVRDFPTPLDYAKEVVASFGTGIGAGKQVLDTCMGLGYTALEAEKKLSYVITCEKHKEVIELAKWNPWSEKLFSSTRVKVEHADISEKIRDLEAESFNAVIHDPPRFSLAPELYTVRFYSELFRVMVPEARMFHYTGSVGKMRGHDIVSKTASRLKEAGFKNIKANARLQGVFCMKPKPESTAE
ncbi:MAG: MnmC family methyltransferase [Candidatus Bilamarchaeaceae archaeon]